MDLQTRFQQLLVRASAELHQDHPDQMRRPDLLPTPNVIDEADLALFYEGLDSGLIGLARGGRFNTMDRPIPDGRWALLSRSRAGGWYNAEYLPQLAAYVELIRRLGYPAGRGCSSCRRPPCSWIWPWSPTPAPSQCSAKPNAPPPCWIRWPGRGPALRRHPTR